MDDRSTRTATRGATVRLPRPRRPLDPARARAQRAPARPPADRLVALEDRVVDALRPRALPALRVLLGLLFVWFGALKLFGASPVESLVAGTLPWADPSVVVPALGGVEVALGVGLVCGVLLRVVLPFLAAHLAGTFLTFLMLPATMFREQNPVLLTADGEFVVKNVVLVSATLVLIAHAPGARTRRDLGG